MNDVERLDHALRAMKHSPLGNYIIPGLTSSLVGGNGHGTVRLFECSREHEESVVPHSHRFDFACLVIRGTVRNRLWGPTDFALDEYRASTLTYAGAPGEYTVAHGEVGRWHARDTVYGAGSVYTMTAKEVHSIAFSRGAMVLFFEGPQVTDESIVLEPFVDGEVVPTFRTEPWMFRQVRP